MFILNANFSFAEELLEHNEMTACSNFYKAVKEDELPYLKGIWPSKKYDDYVINFLLVRYGLRNKDLNIKFTKDKKVISRTVKNKKKYSENYLYPTKSYVWLLISDYKTAHCYGRKKIRIRDSKFLNAVNALVKDNYVNLVCNPKSKTPVSYDGLGRVIQDKTYKKMGEGKIFKCIIKDIFDNYDINMRRTMLNLYSDTRGTSVETIISSYATSIPI